MVPGSLGVRGMYINPYTFSKQLHAMQARCSGFTPKDHRSPGSITYNDILQYLPFARRLLANFISQPLDLPAQGNWWSFSVFMKFKLKGT
jgi:hypothetical protein